MLQKAILGACARDTENGDDMKNENDKEAVIIRLLWLSYIYES